MDINRNTLMEFFQKHVVETLSNHGFRRKPIDEFSFFISFETTVPGKRKREGVKFDSIKISIDPYDSDVNKPLVCGRLYLNYEPSESKAGGAICFFWKGDNLEAMIEVVTDLQKSPFVGVFDNCTIV